MNKRQFTQAFQANFETSPTRTGYRFSNQDESLNFGIVIKEEELSFGEAMGYAPEKDRPTIHPIDAIYDACYEDEDTLAQVIFNGKEFDGHSTSERLRNLLDAAFDDDYSSDEVDS